MRRLAILGEIGAPISGDGRPWGLRRLDLEALEDVRGRLAGRRAVLVTGPAESEAGDGDEGRSVAVGLAAVAAAAGTRTVLVECDLGRPRLAAGLGLAPVPGLHEYLRWEATPEQVVQTLVPAGAAVGAEVPPLACVCAGRPGDSPRTLLGLGSFRHMTAKLRDAYELAILLGPPLDGSDGALGLAAAEAEASIAALPRRPDRRTAKATLETLTALPAAPLGALVVTTA